MHDIWAFSFGHHDFLRPVMLDSCISGKISLNACTSDDFLPNWFQGSFSSLTLRRTILFDGHFRSFWGLDKPLVIIWITYAFNLYKYFTSQLLKNLVERRRMVKSWMKNASGLKVQQLDIQQQALKLTANRLERCLDFWSHSLLCSNALFN